MAVSAPKSERSPSRRTRAATKPVIDLGSKPKPREKKKKLKNLKSIPIGVNEQLKGSRPRVPPKHPSYLQMATEAIAGLKERTGSSRHAIAKYIEDHYRGVLPPNFRKLLSGQLRNLSQKGKLTKVKASFKLSEELKNTPTVKAIKAAIKKQSSDGKDNQAKKSKKPNPEEAAPKAVKASKPKVVRVAKVMKVTKALKAPKTVKGPKVVAQKKLPAKRSAPPYALEPSKVASAKKNMPPSAKRTTKSTRAKASNPAKSATPAKRKVARNPTAKSTAGTPVSAKRTRK